MPNSPARVACDHVPEPRSTSTDHGCDGSLHPCVACDGSGSRQAWNPATAPTRTANSVLSRQAPLAKATATSSTYGTTRSQRTAPMNSTLVVSQAEGGGPVTNAVVRLAT